MKILGERAVKQIAILGRDGYIETVFKDGEDKVFLSKKGVEFLHNMIISQYERETKLTALTPTGRFTDGFADYILGLIHKYNGALFALIRFPEWYTE